MTWFSEGEPDQWRRLVASLGPPLQLNVNSPVSDQFASSPCHLYSVQVDEAGIYEFETFGSESEPRADTVLRLVRADDARQIGLDDDHGDWLYSRLREDLEANRLYHLLVTSHDFIQRGDYSLEVRLVAPGSEGSIVGPLRPEAVVPDAEPVAGRIEDGESEVWYRLSVPSDGMFYIETLLGQEPLLEVDTVVRLFQRLDGSLVLIGEDDDGKGDEFGSSLLGEHLEAGQEYLLRVSSYWGGGGVFRVALRRGDPRALGDEGRLDP